MNAQLLVLHAQMLHSITFGAPLISIATLGEYLKHLTINAGSYGTDAELRQIRAACSNLVSLVDGCNRSCSQYNM